MKRSIRKIADGLVAMIDADNVNPDELRTAARRLQAQAEMLEEGLED